MQVQQDGLWALTVSTTPTTTAVYVCLAGAIDAVTGPPLQDVVEQVRDAAPGAVLIDLARVTFASSALVNFIARIRIAVAPEAVVAVCRPTSMTRLLLTLTGMGSIPILNTAESPLDADRHSPAAGGQS
ncbi:STAS domain-containing protein [Dactylosporangium sp. NPDC049140]|uniref:STAS domain-containing protein n=1 Tax=Dactylosporangium sp. NPDC049140 TaxID=3155647 RepID=UPI003403EE6B